MVSNKYRWITVHHLPDVTASLLSTNSGLASSELGLNIIKLLLVNLMFISLLSNVKDHFSEIPLHWTIVQKGYNLKVALQ